MGDRGEPGHPESASARPAAGPPSQDKPARGLPKWWLRRRFIVNPRRQLRAAILVSAVSMIPVVMLNFSLGYARALERDVIFGNTPEDVEWEVWASDRKEALLVIAASLVYLVGVFAITVVETHQTSGAAVGVARHLRRIRDGRYEARLSLRGSDNLQELTEPYNQMAIALQARTIRLADGLDELAAEAEGLGGAEPIARRLRELAGDQRRLSGKHKAEDCIE